MTAKSSSTPARTPGARRGSWHIATRGLALLAALALVCELGFRGLQWVRGRPCSSLAIREEMRGFSRARLEIESPASPGNDGGERFSHPYFGFELVSGQRELDRLLETRTADPHEDRFTVLLLGGTLASSFAREGRVHFEQALLGDARFPGGAPRGIECLDFARPGFKEPQQALVLQYLLGLGITPDAVLALDGFDELTGAAENLERGTHPLFPAAEAWSSVAARGATDRLALDRLVEARRRLRSVAWWNSLALRFGAYHSAALGELVLAATRHAYEASQRGVAVAMDRIGDASRSLTIRGPAPPAGEASFLQACVHAWAEGSRAIHDLCSARGIAFAQILVPPWPEGSALASSSANTSVRMVELGYPLLRKAGDELAERGITFMDASRLLESAGLSNDDGRRLSPEAREQLAEICAEALLDSLSATDGARR